MSDYSNYTLTAGDSQIDNIDVITQIGFAEGIKDWTLDHEGNMVVLREDGQELVFSLEMTGEDVDGYTYTTYGPSGDSYAIYESSGVMISTDGGPLTSVEDVESLADIIREWAKA